MLSSLAIIAFLSSWIVADVVSGAEHNVFHHPAEDSSFSGWEERSWPGNFFLFGRILLPDGTWNGEICHFRLSVRIGKKVWEHPLDSAFFAFHASTDFFLETVGIFTVLLRDSYQQLWEPLWSQRFLIEGSSSSEVSFQELQVDIASALPLLDKCSLGAVSIGGEHETRLSSAATRISLPGLGRANTKWFCPAPNWQSDWHLHTCPSRAQEGIASSKNLAIHSTAVAIATPSELLINDETLLLTISPPLQLPADDKATRLSTMLHLRGGISFSWLLLFIFLIGVLYLLKSLWNQARNKNQVVGESPKSAPWQVRLCCASSDGTVRGQSVRTKYTLLDTGRGSFRDAWEESEFQLSGLQSQSCCFYYNCSSHNSQGNLKQAFQPGRWNRDKTGRLMKTAD